MARSTHLVLPEDEAQTVQGPEFNDGSGRDWYRAEPESVRYLFGTIGAMLGFQGLMAPTFADGASPSTLLAVLAFAVAVAAGGCAALKDKDIGDRKFATAVIVFAILVALIELIHLIAFERLAYTVPLAFLMASSSILRVEPKYFRQAVMTLSLMWFATVEALFPLPDYALTALGMAAVGLTSLWLNGRQWSRMLEVIEIERERISQQTEEAERIAAAEAKRKLNELAVQAASDGHWYWDLKTDTFHFSAQWAQMLGFEPDELSQKPEAWFERLHPHYLPELKRDLAAHLYGGTPRLESQYRIQKRDGDYIWVLCRGQANRDAEGNPLAVAGSQTDVTHLVSAEKEMINEAFQDRLTGLANRKAFSVRLDQAFERKETERCLFAVIFTDLDRFKVINDSHGHLVGDKLLAAAAGRLKGCLRQGTGDILARFGGDEFVALLEDIQKPEDALKVAERFRQALKTPFQIEEHELQTGTSIGIAFSDSRVERPEDILRNADTAMYRAKERRDGRAQVFNEEMLDQALRAFAIESDLSRALDRDQFVLRYQPVVSLVTGAIVGAEALLRWQRSEAEWVTPAEFIPVAEETGAIDEIGEWVLEQACLQAAAWRRQGLPLAKMAVNLSAKQLHNKELCDTVSRILQSTGVTPRWLELELTETALMENLDDAARAIQSLRALGVRLAIDDFGTGYSSLSYLKRFPFDTLKMDRSFVADVTSDRKSQAVAQGLSNLAHNLRLKVTAEGVESAQQARLLRGYGCDYCQGFLTSRAVSHERFAKLARQMTPFPQLQGVIGARTSPDPQEALDER